MTTESMPAIRETPIETVTPIRPSEAIRLGCLVAPNQLIEQGYVDEPRAACVYGATAIGFGGWDNAHDRASGLLWDARFTRANLPDGCPVEGCTFEWGYGEPMHLNDDHRWSRERIADWLEGLGL